MFTTILTADWLKNNLDISLNFGTAKENATFRDYYLKVCQIIYDNFYLKPSATEIEEFIENGNYTYTDAEDNETIVASRIIEKEYRQYLFLLAQAKQLQYEKLNGVAGLINDGQKQLYKACPEVIDIIKQLGLYQRSFALR